MSENTKLVIIGDGAFAQVATEYFREDSNYEVAGFAVERDYLRKTEMLDLPVVALEDVETIFPPADHDAFAAITYIGLNRLRTRLAAVAKAKGYRLASFISGHARIAKSARLGEHCFIFEGNVVQPYVTLGANVVLWSGNHIGHHSEIGDNCFISSHVVVSGYCDIGTSCFFGANAAIANNLRVAKDCWVGPGVVISANAKAGQMFPAAKATASRVNTHRFFKVEV